MSVRETDIPNGEESTSPVVESESTHVPPKEVTPEEDSSTMDAPSADSSEHSLVLAATTEVGTPQDEAGPIVPGRTKRKHQNEGMSINLCRRTLASIVAVF